MLVMQSPKYIAMYRTSRVPAVPPAAAAKDGCSPAPGNWGELRCPEKTRGDSEKAVENVSAPLVWCLLFEELQSVMDQLAQVQCGVVLE